MQIASFLRRGGATVYVLLGVPLLAMAGAGVVASGAEPTYRTVATVVVGSPSGATGGAAVSQAVEGFRTAVTTDVVLEEAAATAEDDLTSAELLSVMSSRRLGASSVVELVYDGPRRDDVDVLLLTQAKAAVQLLFSSELTSAELARDSAEERLVAATAELRKVEQATGLLLPEEDYRTTSGEVTALRVAVAQTASRGVETAAVAAALARAEAKQRDLAAKAAQFEQPRYVLEQARKELTDAQVRLADVQTRLASSESPALLRVGQGQEQPTTLTTARAVVSAGVLGLLFALALLYLFDSVAGPRRRAEQAVLADDLPHVPLPERAQRKRIAPRSSTSSKARESEQGPDLVPSARREA